MLNLLHDHEVRNEGIAIGKQQGIAIGKQQGSSKMMNTMLELMRTNGVSLEQIETIKAEALKAIAAMTLNRRLLP